MIKLWLTLLFLLTLLVNGFAANRYWVRGTGNTNDSTHWATTSGGTDTATIPSTSDTAYIDGSSDTSTAFALTVNSALSVVNFIATGLDTTFTLTLSANLTTSGTFRVDGQNATKNRILIQSNSLGVARTITAATTSITNADFKDIASAGAGSWDLSSITGGSGDCGGNTGITFTAAAALYWHANTGNWSDTTKWFDSTNGTGATRAFPPLAQDDCYFDLSSFDSTGQNVAADMLRLGKNIYWTGVLNTPTMVWLAGGNTIFGNMTLASNMNVSGGGATNSFEGRNTNYYITTAGKTLNSTYGINGVNATYNLVDGITHSGASAGYLRVNYGTCDTGGYNVTVPVYSASAGTTVILRNSNVTLYGTGTNWTQAGTINAGTSTITITDTSTTSKTFSGGGKIYNNLTWNGGNSQVNTIIGSNNFTGTLTLGGSATYKFTDSTTQTVGSLVTSGTRIVLTGTGTAGWNLSDSSGINAVSNCTISYCTASGGAVWAADDGTSINGGNNSTNNNSWGFSKLIVGE